MPLLIEQASGQSLYMSSIWGRETRVKLLERFRILCLCGLLLHLHFCFRVLYVDRQIRNNVRFCYLCSTTTTTHSSTWSRLETHFPKSGGDSKEVLNHGISVCVANMDVNPIWLNGNP